MRSRRPGFTLYSAGLSSFLILFEYLLSPHSAAIPAYALGNRLLALATVCLTVFLIMKYRRGTAAKAHLAALVNSSDDAIISKSLKVTIETWNRGAERLYGYRSEEVIGRPMTLLTPPGRQDELSLVLTRVKDEQHIRDGQGAWVPFEMYIREHSEAEFSHGLCPACLQNMQQLNRPV